MSSFGASSKSILDPHYGDEANLNQEFAPVHAPKYLIEHPNTIWQVGKCVFQILTGGRFWSGEYNCLSPTDNGEVFGKFKQQVLQKVYSKNLMKYVLACISAEPTNRYSRGELLEHFKKVLSIYEGTYLPDPSPSTHPLIPNGLSRDEFALYEKLLNVVDERAKHSGDSKQPVFQVIAVTDLAKDYDDLLAMMVLKELPRLSVKLEGFVANLMPSRIRALFGRGALDSLSWYLRAYNKTARLIRTVDPHLPGTKELYLSSADSKNDVANTVLPGGYQVLNRVLTADSAALPKRATTFKRKAVELLIKGKKCFARPDTGSDRNIMTEAFAKEHGLEIHRNKNDKELFCMGNGQYTQSIGRALVPCRLLGDKSDQSYWFHVMEKCSAPIIMGLKFLQKIQLYTKNKHLLVDSPFSFGNIPSFKWMGSPKGRMRFSADCWNITAYADTGSDLDLMSLDCALKRGFRIDESRRNRVMLADGAIAETAGMVDVSSVQLAKFDSFGMSFHVLPNLVCDVIFGEEFLEQMDAFNTCEIFDEDDVWDIYSLNPLINLGPTQSFVHKIINRKRRGGQQQDLFVNGGDVSRIKLNTARRDHDERREAELYRQHKVDRLIDRIRDQSQKLTARTAEDAKRKAFQDSHLACVHCTDGSVVTPSRSSASRGDGSGSSSQ